MSLGEVCARIGKGEIVLDAVVAEGAGAFHPITQFPVFAKAFETRYGIDGHLHTSESTPDSGDLSYTPKSLTPIDPLPSEEITTGSSDEPTPIALPGLKEPEEKTPAEEHERTEVTSSPAPIQETTSDVEASTPVTARAIDPLPAAAAVRVAPPPPEIEETPSIALLTPKEVSRRVGVALVSWGIVVGVLFGAGVIGELGWTEAQYAAASGFFFLRVVVLTVLGFVLSAIVLPMEPPTAASFAISWRWAVGAIAAGAVGGAIAPHPRAPSALPIALSMTVLHAISEESFFRGFLDRALAPALPELSRRVATGAALYGMYTLTYASMWLGRSFFEALLCSAAMTLIAGVPLSLAYHASRSFLVPLLLHVVFNGVLVVTAR
jgi:membrane protease YdiL (CAAX protease family)